MSETGSVKFTCEHVHRPLGPFAGFDELNACRRTLRQLSVLGVDAHGIGFGNLSVRDSATNNFYITGSATGAQSELTPDDYARVVAIDLERNWLRCEGATIASSESLTHAAVYRSEPATGAVIHGHGDRLWRRWSGVAPTTSPLVDYGTPEMAREVQRLFHETDVRQQKLFIMGGHADGFVAFGRDLPEALAIVMQHL